MNGDTRQSLGIALLGAVLLALGLVAQVADADAVKGFGGVLMWAGGLLALIGVLRIAFGLIRPAGTD